MNHWIKLYLVSKWILIIGLGPFLYNLMLRVFLMVCNSIFQWESYKSLRIFVNTLFEAVFWIGLPILLIILLKKQKKQSFAHIKEVSDKFKTGIKLTSFGHLGLLLFILTFFYPKYFDHMYFIPYMLWMGFFYIIDLKIIFEFLDSQESNKISN